MIHAANTPLPVPGGMPITDKVIPLPPQGGTNWAWVQWPHQSPGGKVTWEYSRQPQCDHCGNYGHTQTSCPDLPGACCSGCGGPLEEYTPLPLPPGGIPITDTVIPLPPHGGTKWAWIQWPHRGPDGKVTLRYLRQPQCDHCGNYAHTRTSCPDLPGTRYTCCGRTKEDEQYTEHGPGLAGPMEPAGQQQTHQQPPRPPMTDQRWNYAEQTTNTLPPRPPTTEQGWNHAEQTMNTLQQIHQTPPSYRQRRGKKGKGGRNLDQRMDRLVEDLAEIRTDLERAVKYMAQLKDRVNGQWDPQATSTFSLLNQTLNMIQSNVNENSNKDIYNCLNEGIVQREGESHPPLPGNTHFGLYPFQDGERRQEQTPRQGQGEGSPLGPRAQTTRHSGAARRGRGKGDKPPPSGSKEYAPTFTNHKSVQGAQQLPSRSDPARGTSRRRPPE